MGQHTSSVDQAVRGEHTAADSSAQTGPVRRVRVAATLVLACGLVIALSVVHLAQGTADLGLASLFRLVTGQGTEAGADIAVASRLPRLIAGLVVGAALGLAGAVLQSVTRNPLASPDTLAVNAGAFLAVTAAAAFGLTFPVLPRAGLAFAGGLLAAGVVLVLSSGGRAGPARLVLAGTAIALALAAVTSALLLLFAQETAGLFAWGGGSLAQIGFTTVAQMVPVVAVGGIGLLLLARRLDLMAVGDDSASVLGVDVTRTRVLAVVGAVALSSAAVTVAGPIGFVGLCAPALVRLAAAVVPGLMRHHVLLPASALTGVIVVLGADVALRAAIGPELSVQIPTGVATSLVGAVFLVALATRHRDSGPTRMAPAARSARLLSARGFATVLLLTVAVAISVVLVGSLLGDQILLVGDITNWLTGHAGPGVSFVLETRMPRVAAAVLAGCALALAGTVIQAVCRNPLAEPGILGVSGGAGVAGVLTITLVPLAGTWAINTSALVGALLSSALVFGLSLRGGLGSDRLVLIGVGVSAGCAALVTFIIVLTDPFNAVKALTWLAGSTYGVTTEQLVPLMLVLAVTTPLIVRYRRELDLVALDDDTPRVLGVRLVRTRVMLLTGAALLTAVAVSTVGVVGFVGLVAPHAARSLVGSRHTRVLPVAALLGAVLLSLGDTVGRSAIAPAQLPAGLLAAIIGAPYFVWLLWRARATS